MKKFIKLTAIAMLSLSTVTIAESLVQPTYSQASTVSISKLKKANKALSKSLKEGQKFNDQGEDGYDWTSYVSSMKINNQKQLTIQLNAKGTVLTSKALKDVATSAEKSATATLMVEEIIKPEDTNAGLYTMIHYGKRSLGRSTLTDNYKFKIYQ